MPDAENDPRLWSTDYPVPEGWVKVGDGPAPGVVEIGPDAENDVPCPRCGRTWRGQHAQWCRDAVTAENGSTCGYRGCPLPALHNEPHQYPGAGSVLPPAGEGRADV